MGSPLIEVIAGLTENNYCSNSMFGPPLHHELMLLRISRTVLDSCKLEDQPQHTSYTKLNEDQKRGRIARMPSLLGVVQPRGECTIHSMVWTHTVQDMYSVPTVGSCQIPIPPDSASTICIMSLVPIVILQSKLRFPSKNFFLLWLVESANGNRIRFCPSSSNDQKKFQPSPSTTSVHQSGLNPSSMENLHEPSSASHRAREGSNSFLHRWRVCAPLRKSLALLVHLTAKFPVVAIFMMIVLYVIPASAAILVAYLLLTFLFALPSFLVLYFSYPILNWLVREIIA
ncbi:hypothetical protein BVC80_8731g3 [Macleaya cordata]|uniref:Uncharacterized protein n=1 Tax=Macleaya cordata TaxID=56857 RepID=A0A200QBV3_MACCD|nr:hypothetical protein BVC80_8731g3 [Macleaya cordata]